ncbi:hypothetical protein [Microbaculum sp. FT89]|uniref:hypothetical protein n=1 Tax=Microbaculum sp. FT89 TaxID=3447298 RepID=UPI003F5353E5
MPAGVDGKSKRLETPRAAAVAGILFSVLFLAALILLLEFARIRSLDTSDWLGSQAWKVGVALNLIPFSGIAFLWFVGVLRDRLGSREDRLFATVFLGSGLLFVGMIFVSASAVGAIVFNLADAPPAAEQVSAIRLVRFFAYNLASIYALKMAAVFTLTASTLILRTRFTARWVAFAGYTCAAVLLIASQSVYWTIFLFPVWVLIVSVTILYDEFGRG